MQIKFLTTAMNLYPSRASACIRAALLPHRISRFSISRSPGRLRFQYLQQSDRHRRHCDDGQLCHRRQRFQSHRRPAAGSRIKVSAIARPPSPASWEQPRLKSTDGGTASFVFTTASIWPATARDYDITVGKLGSSTVFSLLGVGTLSSAFTTINNPGPSAVINSLFVTMDGAGTSPSLLTKYYDVDQHHRHRQVAQNLPHWLFHGSRTLRVCSFADASNFSFNPNSRILCRFQFIQPRLDLLRFGHVRRRVI